MPNDFHSLISGTIRNSSFLAQFLVALKNLPLAFECLCQIPMWYHVHGLVPKKQVTRYFSVLRELPVWQEGSWCTSGLTGSKNQLIHLQENKRRKNMCNYGSSIFCFKRIKSKFWGKIFLDSISKNFCQQFWFHPFKPSKFNSPCHHSRRYFFGAHQQHKFPYSKIIFQYNLLSSIGY